MFIRGEGGWGGDRGPSGPTNVAARPRARPRRHLRHAADQALTYRLSGDRNPLHSDPEFAKAAGFPKPILHGLCTYGFTGRALLHSLCGSDPRKFTSMEARFSKPVFPGDSLTVKMWVDGNEAIFRTERQDGDIVIDQGRATFLVVSGTLRTTVRRRSPSARARARRGSLRRVRRARRRVADVRRVAARVHGFQIDPINVLVRTQYMPAFSRLGPYPVAAFDSLAYERHELFEYVGHAASFLPTALYPLFRWRMDAHADGKYRLRKATAPFVAAALAEVEARGPIAASDLTDRGNRGKHAGGWSWSDGKRVMSGLLLAGQVAVAGRRGIEQLYDLTERVIPPAVLDAPVPDPDDAKRELVVLAARAMGVSTAKDLADVLPHRRLPRPGCRSRRSPASLRWSPISSTTVVCVPVTVEGWRDPAFLAPGRARARRRSTRAPCVSPFDSLIWERDRVRRLFGFDYRIEIYIPEPKRVHGYYVLPFLLGDTLVGARRPQGRPQGRHAGGAERVRGARRRKPKDVAGALAGELAEMADVARARARRGAGARRPRGRAAQGAGPGDPAERVQVRGFR